jgi:hypothetical protein
VGSAQVAPHGLHLPGLGLGQAPVQLLHAVAELLGHGFARPPLFMELLSFFFHSRPKEALFSLGRPHRFLESPDLEPQLV